MEEEVDYILSNNTNTTEDVIRPLHYAKEAIVLTICVIGIISDSFIIYIVAKNKKMQSRTNILIMNLAINDAIYLLGTPAVISALLSLTGLLADHYFGCFANHIDAVSQLASWLIIAAIISDWLIKTRRISTRIILAIIYAILVCLMLISTTSCLLGWHFPLVYLLAGVTIIIITITMFVKEIIKCCSRKTNSIPEREMIRMNIGRIFTYVWFSSIMLLFIAQPMIVHPHYSVILEYILSMGYLCPLYILLYLASADKYFKLCLLNIFRKKENMYDIDATITFADECDTDTGFENPAVNINFNELDRNKVTA